MPIGLVLRMCVIINHKAKLITTIVITITKIMKGTIEDLAGGGFLELFSEANQSLPKSAGTREIAFKARFRSYSKPPKVSQNT